LGGAGDEATIPYCSQGNSDEKSTRIANTKIAQNIEGHKSSCDELLPETALAVNSSVANSTGSLQGKEAHFPVVFNDVVVLGLATNAHDPKEKADGLENHFYIVHRNLQQASKDYYQLQRREWRPGI